MKKVYFNALIIVSVILSSCSKKANFKPDNLNANTKNIELIDYSDSSTSVAVSVIEDAEIISFIDDFMALNIKITFGAPGSPDGYGIKILYNDGSYHIITKYYMAYFNEDNKLIREDRISLNSKEFDILITKYI